jgi:chloramphenicol O-acetyltransferase type A
MVFVALRAANAVEEFRLRLRGDGIWHHDQIHASTTVLLSNSTIAFSFLESSDNLSSFVAAAREARQNQTEDVSLTQWDDRDDVLFFTSLPWIQFTAFTNPQRSAKDSTPKIAFGRYHLHDGRWLMPVSVEVHHSLVDGIHVARFLELCQQHVDAWPHVDLP